MAAEPKLSSYRAKRDFTKTAEPSGETRVAPSEVRRFVIQKHRATRLHYDFRLELDGVFKSWAVTRGPSLDPHDKRLAVEVEDHPLDYGDFEGTIPKGQYGGGTVQLWDRGYWMPEDDDPEAAIKSGELKFVLEGERLHGGFVLVRIKGRRHGDKKNNWLLIKHRDQFSKDGFGDAILAEDRSVASGRAMAQIAEGKGRGPEPFMLTRKKAAAPDAVWHSNRGSAAELRDAGVMSAAQAPKPAPIRKPAKHRATMPAFIEPQLCRDVDRPPGSGWVHEIKFDGYRIQVRVDDGRVEMRTRKGLDWTGKFGAIARAAAKLPDAIIDGEVVALDDKGAPSFGALQVALSEGKTDKLICFAFDLLFIDGASLLERPLRERKSRLKELLESHAVDSRIRYVEHFDVPGESVLESARRMSLEGIVSKHLEGTYRPGRREWAKTKCRNGQEVVIGGWTSEGKRFRSLLAGVYRDKQLVYAGRVGTGFGADVVDRILPRLEALESDENPFAGDTAPRKEVGVHWIKPELVAEIEFGGWTTDNLVRQSSFKGLRDDKPASEVVVERPEPVAKFEKEEALQEETVPLKVRRNVVVAPALKTGGNAMVMGTVISHPDKAMWPDAGDGKPVTKLDLAQYYEAVGPFIIDYIRGRPSSIVRAPDGIGHELFFQRHGLKGMSKLLKLVKVPGDHEPYLQIDSHEALIAVAQIAGLEIHPWNCMPDEPEVPGRLVFDFDPAPDVDFDVVIEGARELRDRLTHLGLVSFCKTTGGKGLHVVTPLAQPKGARLQWPIVKQFAHEVAQQMAADNPERYLTTMAKKARSGKIFLDYLRNDRLSTAVAVLSPRAREGARVSMPLDWSQVKAGLDPARFTVRTAPALLARSKAWKEYGGAERSLVDAVRRLSESHAA
ncbi:MAG TPA: DNA ligase D [Candidatus Binataceae bacterium]|nr:DNA ligase D [Candidatus Binataceae bacterium]